MTPTTVDAASGATSAAPRHLTEWALSPTSEAAADGVEVPIGRVVGDCWVLS